MKDYVRTYSSKRDPVPPEHVLIYDEAQRAWDAAQVRRKHKDGDLSRVASEPELFIEFAERVPEWCVVLALIGGGQEIHVGEEGGIGQWARAIRESPRRHDWSVAGPEHLAAPFHSLPFEKDSSLHLTAVLRAHRADVLDEVVKAIVDGPADAREVRPRIEQLEAERFALRLTRDLGKAKRYVRERYAEQADARYGLLVSARVRAPEQYGIQAAPRFFQVARWFADGDESSFSCRNLAVAPSEFDVQGLELDAAILAWGEDFILDRAEDGRWVWSNTHAKQYRKQASPDSPLELRRNAYRVLMTRGRDGLVIWVPPDP
ncbi:MAG: DNA/RNA helicase domain-containing protein, partial [Phycisphaerales bacterium]